MHEKKQAINDSGTRHQKVVSLLLGDLSVIPSAQQNKQDIKGNGSGNKTGLTNKLHSLLQ